MRRAWYPEHDLSIQLKKLKNTLREWRGEALVTHLGAEYYDDGSVGTVRPEPARPRP